MDNYSKFLKVAPVREFKHGSSTDYAPRVAQPELWILKRKVIKSTGHSRCLLCDGKGTFCKGPCYIWRHKQVKAKSNQDLHGALIRYTSAHPSADTCVRLEHSHDKLKIQGEKITCFIQLSRLVWVRNGPLSPYCLTLGVSLKESMRGKSIHWAELHWINVKGEVVRGKNLQITGKRQIVWLIGQVPGMGNNGRSEAKNSEEEACGWSHGSVHKICGYLNSCQYLSESTHFHRGSKGPSE